MTTAFQNNAFQLDAFQIEVVTGTISATDSPDSGNLAGTVTDYIEVYGTISTTDALEIGRAHV